MTLMRTLVLPSLLGLTTLGAPLVAQEASAGSSSTSGPAVIEIAEEAGKEADARKSSSDATEEAAVKAAEDPEEKAMTEEKKRLELENSLLEERVKHETAQLRAEAARLKVEKELISERLELAAMKRRADDEVAAAKAEAEKVRLGREAELAKARAETLTAELKAIQAEAAIEIAELKGEIERIQANEQRADYTGTEPTRLENPLREDGTLIISERRIPLNGPIVAGTANAVTERIHYYNNQNRELPIFVVIDDCPGGSVMAGYRILKAMEASDAPIHVVVKSFAASMAAAITTLAEESYCYPNAVILHHQISALAVGRLNLTEQEEFLKESQRWWRRLAKPIADKMGLTLDEFISRMYAHSSSGDWSEFGEQAHELKWVEHIIHGIEETSLVRNPNAVENEKGKNATRSTLAEEVDEKGQPVMYLPRPNPKDAYFIYNPDGYYRLR